MSILFKKYFHTFFKDSYNGKNEGERDMKVFLIYLVYLIVLLIIIPCFTVIIFDENRTDADLIKVYITSEDKVEEMDREEYLKGVVAAEMPADFELEALKAQAVAARTYMEAHINDKNKEEAHKGADICTDYAHCAAWISKEDRFSSWGDEAEGNWEKISSAVEETNGEVIFYDNKIISAVFHSTSSGRTENAEDVWSKAVPYLKGVESKGDEFSPKFHSQMQISKAEFKNTILKEYNDANPESPLYDNIDRTESGGIKNILVLGKKISGPEFRKLFNLKSTNVEFSENEDNVIMKTRGYGHGVGMSQYGANYMAQQGKNYKEILTHYYTGVEIKR